MNKHYKMEVYPITEKTLNDVPKRKINFSEIYGGITMDSFNLPIVADNSTGNDIRILKLRLLNVLFLQIQMLQLSELKSFGKTMFHL